MGTSGDNNETWHSLTESIGNIYSQKVFELLRKCGIRCCFSLLSHARKEGGKNFASFFRKPDEHVYSLYLECKYDKWGQQITNHTDFPRDPTEDITRGSWAAMWNGPEYGRA